MTTSAPVVTFVGDVGNRLFRLTQRYIPDSWVVCMAVTVVAARRMFFTGQPISAADGR